MAQTSDNYRQIVLDDFRPGIHSDYHGAAGQPSLTTTGFVPLPADGQGKPVYGAATMANTYRCCADPYSGALIPLPKVTLVQSQTLLPGGNTNVGTTFYPSGLAAAFLVDAELRVNLIDGTGTALIADSSETAAMYQFYWDPAGASTYKWFCQGVLWQSWHTGIPIKHWCWHRVNVAVSPYPLMPGGMCLVSAQNTVSPTPGADFVPVIAACVIGPGQHVVGAIPAAENAVMTYDTDMSAGANYTLAITAAVLNSVMLYPRPVGTRTAGRHDIFEQVSGAFKRAWFPISHQGRLVCAGFTSSGPGGDATQGFGGIETIEYCPPIDPLADVAASTWTGRKPAVLGLGQENPSQIGILGSISADELLIVKVKDGGYLVRGDLDNPTVQRLPFLTSTGGISSRGIGTPIGFVYGSRFGIYAYTGGEQAQLLSPQIEGFFWNVYDPTEKAAMHGKIGYLHPWVAVPNNFFYDTRTSSWWRIELPDATNGPLPFSTYVALTHGISLISTTAIGPSIPKNNLRCFPYKLTATRNEAFYDIDPSVLASSYSWQSHPIFAPIDKYFDIQDITLIASIPGGAVGVQTVAVTITGYAEDGTVIPGAVTTTFTLGVTTTNPQQSRKDVAPNIVNAAHFQVRITASDSGTAPAPKVHGVAIGMVPHARVAKD